jgi:exodeoxyribonuclease VII large subunit
MTLPFAEETYTVSRLGAEVRDFVGQAFRGVWVMGEVRRPRANPRGHLYFELVEKGEADDIVGRLDAVVFRGDLVQVRRALRQAGQELDEGIAIRCRADLDFYPAGGRLQLVVRAIDPVFTLGLLARRRQQTLEALAAAGLLERNRALPLAELPLCVGLVTSHGSAAYHDFLATLRESGYGFRVLFAHAAVQGPGAERELVSALATLGGAGCDCVALVRGGGARSDLQVFDSRRLAEAVARLPRPVLTGLGHEIDQSIADRVAHSAFKTPTKVAEHLVALAAAAEQAVRRLQRDFGRVARRPLDGAGAALARAERAAAVAGGRLRAVDSRLAGLARRLREAGTRRLESARRAPPRVGQRLLDLARGRLREAAAQVRGLARLAAGLGPERTLRRGYSITRSGAGRLLRRPEDAPPGERLVTQLAGGVVRSRVEGG